MSEVRLRLALAALAVVGLGIATYLTVVHYQGDDPVCLAGGHGCATVQKSDYAEMAGIPVPLIGLFGYLTLLVAAALRGDPGRVLGLFAGGIGFGFSIYLTYLELFVIDAICHWCVASAVVMTLAFIVALIRAVRFTGTNPHARGSVPATD
jgi:uncharacterized membrane protein